VAAFELCAQQCAAIPHAGLLANREVAAGEVVLQVPGDLAITSVDVGKDPALAPLAEGRSELVGLALWLMQERGKVGCWACCRVGGCCQGLCMRGHLADMCSRHVSPCKYLAPASLSAVVAAFCMPDHAHPPLSAAGCSLQLECPPTDAAQGHADSHSVVG